MISVAEIKKYGARIGLDVVNVSSAEPFPEYVKTVQDRIEKGLISPESQKELHIFKNVESYSDPKNSLHQARSIISLGMRYLLNDKADCTRPGVPCGRIGRHLWRDFHGRLWEKKVRLVNFLERQGIRCSKEVHLPHKQVAKRAGTGFYGKNCLIQNENYGSWIILGSIVTDADLEIDTPASKNCGSCEACIRTCPTHALVAPYTLNVGRCLDNVLASSNSIPIELRPLIGNRIDSCDRCQEVCPNNRKVAPIRKRFPNPRKKWGISPALIPLLDISAEEYKQSFSDLEFYEKEPKFLQRNAIVALGNTSDPVALPALGKMLRHQESMIRGQVAWAIGRIGGSKAKQLLKAASHNEKSADVQEEIVSALQTLS